MIGVLSIPPLSRFSSHWRVALVLVPAMFAAASLSAATPASEPPPLWLGDLGVDIAAARTHRREARAVWLRWEQAMTLGDYERVGTKDPRWDADARICLEAYAQALVRPPEPGKPYVATAKAAAERALAADCRDPLVRYVAFRVHAIPVDGHAALEAQRYAEAESNLEKSDYSAVRKCYASFRASTTAADAVHFKLPGGGMQLPTVPNPGTVSYKAASLERTCRHFVEMLLDPATPPRGAYELANDLFEFAENDDLGEEKIFAPLEAAFTSGVLKNAPESATLHLVEGMLWTHYGWRARTSKWASEVTDDGWRLFGERLEKAKAALERAYELDPSDPDISNAMLVVELGQGEERADMEIWFRRAMDADPDNQDACHKKIYYLQPKWHGSAEDMRVFGRECLATGNWDAGLPWLLENAHRDIADMEPDSGGIDGKDYWKQPDVWDDMQQLYLAALKAQPDSAKIRSAYANAAFLAGQWKLADELFTALGDDGVIAALGGSRERYAYMRKRAASRAQQE